MSRQARGGRVRPGRALLPVLVGSLMLMGAPADPAARDFEIEVPGKWPTLAGDYGRDGGPVVVVTDQRIGRAVVRVAPGERVAWSSYSGEPIRISFPAKVAKAMRCTSVVNFAIEDDRMRSGILHAGDRAHLCPLEPGVYHYRVERDRMSQRSAALSERLRGTIIVEATESH